MFNAYPLKFPRLSESLTDTILNFAQVCEASMGFDPETDFDSIDKIKGNEYHAATNTNKGDYRGFLIPEDIQALIKEEINNPLVADIVFYLQIMKSRNPNDQNFRLAPHIDPRRTAGFIYNFVEDTASTHFHEGLVDTAGRWGFNLEEISEPIETYQYATHTWYIMNNSQIHSVTDLTKTRIAITTSLDQTSYAGFCDLFSSVLYRD
jgi:hypothetical protein